MYAKIVASAFLYLSVPPPTVHAFAPLSPPLPASSSSTSLPATSSSSSSLAATPPSRRTFLSTGAVAFGALAGADLLCPPSAFAASEVANMLGATAPDFDLPSSTGKGNTTLRDLTSKQKWTVLYFYPGAFTSGCTLEARGFQRDQDAYRSLNAQVVGVSVDPVEKNAQFCAAENLDFFMLSDFGGKVSKRYNSALTVPGFGTFSNRKTYIIGPDGTVRWVFEDVESRVARHSGEVIEKLRELQA